MAGTRKFALTGFDDRETERQIAEAGFDGHILKPVAFPTLLTVLRTTADRLSLG